jgi:hypothetical protein
MGCPVSVIIGENLVFGICTHDPDTGILTDADDLPAYRIYVDEEPDAVLVGNMARLDVPNTTGFYTELIACTQANGFDTFRNYTIYIEATVGGDTGGIAYTFRVGYFFDFIGSPRIGIAPHDAAFHVL